MKEIKVTAKLVDELSPGAKKAVDKTNKELDKVSKGAGTTSAAFKSLGTAMVAAFSIGAIKSFFSKGLKDFDAMIRAQTELERALGYTSEALKRQSEAVQQSTRFTADATTAAQAQMAAFIKDDAIIAKLMPKVLDLAQAKGMDLSSAAEMVTKSVAGEVNALGRLGISLDGAKTQGEKVEAVFQGLDKAFGGAAEAAAAAGAGGIQGLKNDLDDIQKNIAGALLPAMSSLAREWRQFLADRAGKAAMNDWVDDNKAIVAAADAAIKAQKDLAWGEEALAKARQSNNEKEVVRLEKWVEAANERAQKARDEVAAIRGERQSRVDENEQKKQASIAEAGLKQAQSDAAKKKEADEKAYWERRAIQEKENTALIQQELAARKRQAGVDAWKAEQRAIEVQQDYLRLQTKRDIELALMTEEQRSLEIAREQFEQRRSIMGESLENEAMYANEVAEIKRAAWERETQYKQASVDAQIAANNSLAQNVGDISAIIQGVSGKNAMVAKIETLAKMKLAFANALSVPFPANLPHLAQVAAGVATIKSMKAAKGADFMTDGPTMMMVGENPGGRERVQVTPVGSPNVDGPSGGGSIVINIQGNASPATARILANEARQFARTMREAKRRNYV